MCHDLRKQPEDQTEVIVLGRECRAGAVPGNRDIEVALRQRMASYLVPVPSGIG